MSQAEMYRAANGRPIAMVVRPDGQIITWWRVSERGSSSLVW